MVSSILCAPSAPPFPESNDISSGSWQVKWHELVWTDRWMDEWPTKNEPKINISTNFKVCKIQCPFTDLLFNYSYILGWNDASNFERI